MAERRAALIAGAVGLVLTRAAPAAAPPPPASDIPPEAFAAAVTDDTDVLLLPGSRTPPPQPLVRVATRTPASAAAVAAVALDPAAMRRALPSLVRADVVATRPAPRADAWPDRLVAWELEIPLFNLKGKAWLQQRDNAVELVLVDGAFAPGRVRIRLGPRSADRTTVTCELQINVQTSNFVFRRVARHDPWAETAMTGATAWVLVRALALAAENPSAREPPRPSGRIVPPAAGALDGHAPGAPALAPLRALGTVATIRRGQGGRLAWASAAVPIAGAPAVVRARVANAESWSAFPGWGTVTRVGPASQPDKAATRIEVDDNVALVDLDAVWSIPPGLPTRATAVEGDTRGAVLGWDIQPGDHPNTSLAILSMHPRLDTSGFVERRLIAAEPLLEHALAVALAYVDASALAASLDGPPR